jgi:cell division protease FtsH
MTLKAKTTTFFAVLLCVAVVLWLATSPRSEAPAFTYSQFLDQVRAGRVASAVVIGGVSGATPATATLKNGDRVRTVLPADYRDALALMQERSVNIEIRSSSSEPLRILLNATPFLVLLAIWLFFFPRGFRNGRGPLSGIRPGVS